MATEHQPIKCVVVIPVGLPDPTALTKHHQRPADRLDEAKDQQSLVGRETVDIVDHDEKTSILMT
jgi:hypothetical protein